MLHATNLAGRGCDEFGRDVWRSPFALKNGGVFDLGAVRRGRDRVRGASIYKVGGIHVSAARMGKARADFARRIAIDGRSLAHYAAESKTFFSLYFLFRLNLKITSDSFIQLIENVPRDPMVKFDEFIGCNVCL
jgi:hypothetical protein